MQLVKQVPVQLLSQPPEHVMEQPKEQVPRLHEVGVCSGVAALIIGLDKAIAPTIGRTRFAAFLKNSRLV